MIWTKRNHQSAKFQTFDCSREISPNLYFDRLFLLKVYKMSARKPHRSYVSRHVKSDTKFEEKSFCCFKNDKNLVNFDPSTQISQTFSLWPLSGKVYNVWPKKVLRIYLSWQWRTMQNLKKNWLVIWKMTWGIWQIFTSV